MTKLLLSLILLPFLINRPNEGIFPKESIAHKVIWEKGRKLSWSDFKGVPTIESPFAAECNWEIRYNYAYNENRKNKLQFEVYCYFNKTKSWIRPEHKNDQLLQHEQLHFDIAEVCTRKLRKQLAETSFHQEDFKEELSIIFSNTLKECDSLQKLYDQETNHGINKGQQTLWTDKTHAKLEEHEPFKNNLAFEEQSNSTLHSSTSFFTKIFRK